ncbi:MAG: 4Fe-4S binding protein [Thermodesulfobacteriota bacterium]|nr:4Fe-4S binding protein [Thermodesulfobacteriota bacterium]
MSLNTYFSHQGPWSDAGELLLCSDTGSWRTKRPVVDEENCIFCGFCSIYCPVQCMEMKSSFFTADLDFCKGCGICAKECPKNVISMIPEGEFK